MCTGADLVAWLMGYLDIQSRGWLCVCVHVRVYVRVHVCVCACHSCTSHQPGTGSLMIVSTSSLQRSLDTAGCGHLKGVHYSHLLHLERYGYWSHHSVSCCFLTECDMGYE